MRWVQGAGALLFFLFLFPNFCRADDCAKRLGRAKKSSVVKSVVKTALGVLIKPYTFPIKLARAAVQGEDPASPIWAKRVDFLKDGAQALAGYLIYGLVPDTFTLSITDFHGATDKEFWNVSKTELIVLVDGFESVDKMDRFRKAILQVLAQEKQREGWNIIYLSPNSPRELAEQLNSIRIAYGAIARLDIYTHGNSTDGFVVNGYFVNSKKFDTKFFSTVRPVMTNDAVVRINSCLVGKDITFMDKLGRALMPGRGTVFASKLITVPSGTAELSEYLLKKDLPSSLDKLQEITFGKPFNFALLFYLEEENLRSGDGFIESEFSPVQRVEIR